MNDNPIFFDFSKLKPNGYHYIIVKFALPYAIHLPIDSYDIVLPAFENENKLINLQIIIEDAWRNQTETLFPFKTDGIRLEKIKDSEGSLRYTNVLLCIPVDSEKNRASGKDALWNQVAHTQKIYVDLAIRGANRFLDVYRYFAKEHHISTIAGRSTNFDFQFAFLYNENSPSDERSNFSLTLMPVFYWGNIYSKFPDVHEDAVLSIRDFLKSQDEIPMAENLILNTYEYFDQGNYRLAIVEIETAFEAYIQSHLRTYFKNDSNMLAEIDRLGKGSITNLVKSKKMRPAFNGKPFHESTAEFIAWREKVADQRNLLVHGIESNVTKLEAIDAIRTIEETLEFLTERPKTDTYLYLKE